MRRHARGASAPGTSERADAATHDWTPRHRAWAPRHRLAGPPRLAPDLSAAHAGAVGLVAAVGMMAAFGLGLGGLAAGGGADGLTAASATGSDVRTAGLSSTLAAPAAASAGGKSTVAEREAMLRVSNDQLRGQLQASLRRADAGRRVGPRTAPGVDRLRRSLWNGPGRCASGGQTSTHPICSFGDIGGSRTVVAFGSSHMTMWMAGLVQAAAERDTRVVGFFKFGCTPYDLRSSREGVEWQACSDWREWALDKIAGLGPDVVVVGSHTEFDVIDDSGRLLTGAQWQDAVGEGAASLARRLAPSVGDVVVLGDVNPRTKDPTRCLKRSSRSYSRCEAPEDAAHRATVNRVGQEVGAVGADFFDTNHLVCVDRRCPVAAARRYLYRDASHISRVWARHVGPNIATRVGIL